MATLALSTLEYLLLELDHIWDVAWSDLDCFWSVHIVLAQNTILNPVNAVRILLGKFRLTYGRLCHEYIGWYHNVFESISKTCK